MLKDLTSPNTNNQLIQGFVRLKNNPNRVGNTTNKTREHNGKQYIQVQFADRTEWVSDYELEFVPISETPLDRLRQAKFSAVDSFRRILTHVRLTGHLADFVYSMEATNTDYYPYQFKPVLKILNAPTNGILIADEVGLGKTIEAGLIWTELRSRFNMNKLLILCPAVLREKWLFELSDKIGVDGKIVNPKELLHILKNQNNINKGFACIGSMQGFRFGKNLQDNDSPKAKLGELLSSKENDEKLFDLLIIDEAHYLRNRDTYTNEMAHLFRKVSEYVVLLTATPIHNKNDDMYSLLNILDSDMFERKEDFDSILEANKPLIKARDLVLSSKFNKEMVGSLLQHLEDAANTEILLGNKQIESLITFIKEHNINDRTHRSNLACRLERVNLLGHTVTRTRKKDVLGNRVIRDIHAQDIPTTEHERSFYEIVSNAIIRYASNVSINEQFLLSTPQRQMSSCMPAALDTWQKIQEKDILDNEDEDYTDDDKYIKVGPLTQQIVLECKRQNLDLQKLKINDSKYTKLISILKDYLEKDTGRKVIIFSTFKATLKYLSERLSQDGIINDVLTSGIKDSKDEVISRFRESTNIRVLLSSEVGSEGVDLQFCCFVINYDLPWNPMRIEQRIGRLDRIGQKSERIIVWNMFYGETIDSRIYNKLYKKLALCSGALGDFEEVLGRTIKTLGRELLFDGLSKEQQEEKIEQTAQAIVNMQKDQEELEEEATQLTAYGNYILNQVSAAKEMGRWINEEDLKLYVIGYFMLNYPGCNFKQEPDGSYNIFLSDSAKIDLSEYIKNKNFTQYTRLIDSVTGATKCSFSNKLIGHGHSVEIINQFHPVVRFISDHMNREVTVVRSKIRRTNLKNKIETGVYILVGHLWSAQGLTVTERLVFAGCNYSTGNSISREHAEQLSVDLAASATNWQDTKDEINMDKAYEYANNMTFNELFRDYEAFIDEIKSVNEDRANIQLKNLNKHFENHKRRLNEIINIHRKSDNKGLLKSTENKLQTMEKAVSFRKAKIEKSKDVTSERSELCIALIKVYDE